MYCACEHSHTGCMEQLCELKTKLAILRQKYDELEESSELISLADEDANSSKLIEDLINTLVSGLVSEEDFEEYKRQQSNRGYLTQIDPIYITEQELKEVLDSIFLGNAEARYKLWIYEELKDYVKKDNLSTYVAEYLRGHDITLYIDISRLVNQINSLFDNYYTKLEVDTKIDTAKREISDQISQSGTITRNQFGYTPSIQASNPNSYLIGTLKLANDEYRLYGKDSVGSSGGSSSGGYDDSNIRSIIEDLRTRLNNILTTTREEIQNEVTYILNTFDWLRDNVNWGEIFQTSGWNEQFNAYLQSVGLVDTSGTSATWSTLMLKYNEIEAEVTAIRESMNPDGTIDYETLLSNLLTYIDTKTGNAIVNAVSRYARTDADGRVLDWLASGFKSQANSNSTFALMYSTMDGRVAAVETEVSSLKSTAILAAEFDNRVAGVVATAMQDQSTLDLIANHINLTADTVHIESTNPQNEGVIDLAIDYHGDPEIKVKRSNEDPDDELLFGVITSDVLSAEDITPNGTYSRSASIFFGDGSARLAKGNLWWDNLGVVDISAATLRTCQFTTIGGMGITTQHASVSHQLKIEGTEKQNNNVYLTGMYLYNPTTTPATWHRVCVDPNGFLKVDMLSQGDL